MVLCDGEGKDDEKGKCCLEALIMIVKVNLTKNILHGEGVRIKCRGWWALNKQSQYYHYLQHMV